MTSKALHRASLGLLVVSCILFGFLLASMFQFGGPRGASSAVTYPLAGPTLTDADGTLPPQDFMGIADRASAVVVNIVSLSTGEGDSGSGGMPTLQPTPPPRGGSGIIIDADGYILTNWHVVEDSDKVIVTLIDGATYSAQIVGADPNTDLALLRVTPRESLPSAVLGDSDAVRPGEWVVAIGHPSGLSHTVTVGVVSAINRDFTGNAAFSHYIQTDAAINQGNSGGPLLNIRGEVIGINTLIIANRQNLAFSIPINLARRVIHQLRQRGHVRRGYLGLTPDQITHELQQALGLPDTSGAIVSSVARTIEGSNRTTPAFQAGLRIGDIITSFDGERIDSVDDLYILAAYTPPGQEVEIEVLRDGRPMTFELTLASRPGERTVELPSAPRASGRYPLGISVAPIDGGTRRRLRELSAGQVEYGVRVANVEVGSNAFDRQIRPGDIIVRVNGREIGSPDEFRSAVRSGDDAVYAVLYIVRIGNQGYQGRFFAVRN